MLPTGLVPVEANVEGNREQSKSVRRPCAGGQEASASTDLAHPQQACAPSVRWGRRLHLSRHTGTT